MIQTGRRYGEQVDEVVAASTVIVMAVDSSFEKRRACRASKDFV